MIAFVTSAELDKLQKQHGSPGKTYGAKGWSSDAARVPSRRTRVLRSTWQPRSSAGEMPKKVAKSRQERRMME